MFRRNLVFVCALFVYLATAALAQSVVDGTVVVPLTVDKDFPLQVLLTEKLRFKENEPVRGTIIEPVYSFDREVIAYGAEVEGTITGFQKIGRWKRVSSMLGGDFTPLREPQITFHTLILADGTRMPIETSVIPGSEKVVGPDKKNGSDLKNSLMSTIDKPGKERLKSWVWGMAPYHPQYLAAGTHLSAVLASPLDFGEALIPESALADIGSEPPTDTVVWTRLVTPLNTRTTRAGAPVEAQLTRPLFSKDHQLLFPVGSTVRGTVTQAKAAQSRHRHGELTFDVTTIAPPTAWMLKTFQPHSVDGSLLSVQVDHEMKDLRIKDNNSARIVESKKRFIAPAWAFIGAGRSLNNTADPFGNAIFGAYRKKFLKEVTGTTGSGFGLPASISGAMIPPVGIGLSFFGAARSFYSSFLSRGRDIYLPSNTMMEIRLEKRTEDTQ